MHQQFKVDMKKNKYNHLNQCSLTCVQKKSEKVHITILSFSGITTCAIENTNSHFYVLNTCNINKLLQEPRLISYRNPHFFFKEYTKVSCANFLNIQFNLTFQFIKFEKTLLHDTCIL